VILFDSIVIYCHYRLDPVWCCCHAVYFIVYLFAGFASSLSTLFLCCFTFMRYNTRLSDLSSGLWGLWVGSSIEWEVWCIIAFYPSMSVYSAMLKHSNISLFMYYCFLMFAKAFLIRFSSVWGCPDHELFFSLGFSYSYHILVYDSVRRPLIY
jgi:hypothetical protein